MRIYLDSSALVKRVFEEPDADALRGALAAAHTAGASFATSALARVEVGRVTRSRLDEAPPRDIAVASSEAFLGVAIAALSRSVLESARVIGPPVLRSLDAIHLATAIALGVDELWTYDHRMRTVAEDLGIPVRAPL
jgi:predicted nucleic acid-binding protein